MKRQELSAASYAQQSLSPVAVTWDLRRGASKPTIANFPFSNSAFSDPAPSPPATPESFPLAMPSWQCWATLVRYRLAHSATNVKRYFARGEGAAPTSTGLIAAAVSVVLISSGFAGARGCPGRAPGPGGGSADCEQSSPAWEPEVPGRRAPAYRGPCG